MGFMTAPFAHQILLFGKKYMLDLDMVKMIPRAYEDFLQNFRLPDILPGGTHCMMNAVNINGRPFMGPNIYMTPRK